MRSESNRFRSLALALGLVLSVFTGPAAATAVIVTNLVTDDQAAHPAQITDPSLVNAWGMSMSATSPFWVSDNGSGSSTLYSVNPATQVTSKIALTVTIPGAGNVTGQVFNPGTGFNGDRFLFVSEDGTVSGWRPALGTTAEVLATASTDNVYKGTAFATFGGHSYIYAANFRSGAIDVFKDSAASPSLAGNFTDPNVPSGYAPFNIQNLGGRLYVAYAQQDGTKTDEVAGAGRGFVSVFDLDGIFLGRVGSGGSLDAPWGLAIAPGSFGAFAGALLVGNFGDGRINAFDLGTDAFLGQISDTLGNPLSIDGLWGLSVGNDGSGGSSSRLYFTAGPDGESHGLFGVLTAVPEPGTLVLALVALTTLCASARRRIG